jgi:hypothetical protein
MNHNYTHLARKVCFHKPSLKERIVNFFDPAHRQAEKYMRDIGAILDVTYTYLGGYSAGTNKYAPGGMAGVFSVVDIKLDFAAIAAARSAAGQAALGAADVMELIKVPAGTWVPACFIQSVTAEGATATVQLGDGADANGFIDSSSINAVAWYSSLATTAYSVAVGGGKLYSSEDTIDLTLDHASIDTAVIHIFAALVDLRSYR